MIGGLAIYSATPSGNLKIAGGYQQYGSGRPVAWWKMDEASWSSTTGEVIDSIGTNHGIGINGANTTSTAIFRRAGKFDGSNDYVNMGLNTNLNITGKKTISAWVKTSDTNGGIFSKVSWGYSLSLENGYAKGYIKEASIYSVTSTTNVSNNVWHHIVWVFNSNVAQYIYVDGKFEKQASASVDSSGSGTDGRIGYDGILSNGYLNGLIDDVRIYNYALTAGQVQQIYNETAKLKINPNSSAKIKVSTGLVGYWKLDDNNALTSVIDYSGKGNTGTAYSGTATSTSVLSTSTAMVGRAMSFDGVDDKVDITSGQIIGSGAMTISAWIYPKGWGGNNLGRIVDNGKTIFFVENNIKPLLFSSNGGITVKSPADSAIGLNNWYHVAATRDSIGLTNLYVNGQLSGTANESSGTPINGTTDLIIGSRVADNNRVFNGLIDEVKIWNYARSAEQIKQDYERGLKGLP